MLPDYETSILIIDCPPVVTQTTSPLVLVLSRCPDLIWAFIDRTGAMASFMNQTTCG